MWDYIRVYIKHKLFYIKKASAEAEAKCEGGGTLLEKKQLNRLTPARSDFNVTFTRDFEGNCSFHNVCDTFCFVKPFN